MADSRCVLHPQEARRINSFQTANQQELFHKIAVEGSESFTEILTLNGHTKGGRAFEEGSFAIRAFTKHITVSLAGENTVIIGYDPVHDELQRLDVLQHTGYISGVSSLEGVALSSFFFDDNDDVDEAERQRLIYSARGFESPAIMLGRNCLRKLHSGVDYQGVDCPLIKRVVQRPKKEITVVAPQKPVALAVEPTRILQPA